MFENEKRNKVKSITKKRGQLTLTFFDNNGIVKQKDTGLGRNQSKPTQTMAACS